MLGAIFDKINKTDKNVLAKFNETEYAPFFYNAPVPSSSLTTVLNITGDGYISNVTMHGNNGRPTLKITVDGVVRFQNTPGSTNSPYLVIGLAEFTQLGSFSSSYTYVFSPYGTSTYGGADRANLKSYPYVTTGSEDRPLCLVPQKIRFKQSLKVEVAQNQGSANYTIVGGLKV